MQDILFYTTNCPHCSNLIIYITKNLGDNRDMQYISLDNLRMINNNLTAILPNNISYVIPICINSVPSIICRSDPRNQITISGTKNVISYLQNKYGLNNESNEPESLPLNTYANTNAFDTGITSDIQIDPIRKDNNNEIDIEKLKRDRNLDVQMHQRNM